MRAGRFGAALLALASLVGIGRAPRAAASVPSVMAQPSAGGRAQAPAPVGVAAAQVASRRYMAPAGVGYVNTRGAVRIRKTGRRQAWVSL